MTRRDVAWGVVLALACYAGQADAQERAEPGAPGGPGAGESTLGPSPGTGGQGTLGDSPGASEGILGGRPGPSAPRVPQGITRPGAEVRGPARPGIGPVPGMPEAELPLYGPLEIPAGAEDEGPPGGLTLDAAIERLVRGNLDLRSKAVEIPKAEADILTASLRNNPIFYADVQQVPYGSFSEQRPGGPTQYDINITLPLDLSHKRRARTAVACQAKRVLEAQYQDAVRQTLDNLYTAWVDALAARETFRFAEVGVEGLRQVFEETRARAEKGDVPLSDVERIRVQPAGAEVARVEAEQALRDATQALAILLNLPPAEAEALQIRGSLRDPAPQAPPVEELSRIALGGRPDLVAYRLGVGRAAADVALARANRFENVYLMAQPYTFQDLSPFDRQSAHSWAMGLTVPLPIFNRNQGNIRRAQLNVTQTQIQLAELERRVIAEVRQAYRAYETTLAALRRYEQPDERYGGEGILRDARRARDVTYTRYTSGDVGQLEFLNAQREYNEVVRQYRDALVRHRRAMLKLNTAVGQRILP